MVKKLSQLLIIFMISALVMSCTKSSGLNDEGEDDVDDSESTREVLPFVTNAKNWVLTHAPNVMYDAEGESYLTGKMVKAGCVPIIFLYNYYTKVSEDADVLTKIQSLANFAISLQNTNEDEIGYGGYLVQEGGNRYYSIGAAFCGEAMIYAYRLTNDEKYLTSAKLAGDFLRKMQTPNDLPFPFTNNVHRDDNGDPVYYGAFAEFYDSRVNSIDNSLYTKMLLAFRFLKEIYFETRDEKYIGWANDLSNSILREGLTNGSLYFRPKSFGGNGDGEWHGVKDREIHVYADSMTYALDGLYYYEGNSEIVNDAYKFFNSFTGGEKAPNYDPDICWAGYLKPSTRTTGQDGSPYYDLVNIGLLMEYRKTHDVSAYEKSRNAVVANQDAFMYWATDMNYVPINSEQATLAISYIANSLIQTDPYSEDQ